MAIQSSTLTLGTGNIFISSGNTVISTMYFCNYGPTAANLNVYMTSAGSVFSTTANLVYREVQIAAADTFVIDREKLVFANGDYIRANASGTVTATVNWVGI